MYVLATTRCNHEFAVADALNAMTHRPDPDGDLRSMGVLAVVPRRLDITPARDGKPERIDYRPLLPRMLFLACSEAAWHIIRTKPLMGPVKPLPPVRRELDVLPRSWAGLQQFAERAEQECEYRLGLHEAGRKVRNLRLGDIIQMISGAIGDVELAGRMGRVVRVQHGKVHVQTDVEFMGKPVVARLDPGDVTGMAAE